MELYVKIKKELYVKIKKKKKNPNLSLIVVFDNQHFYTGFHVRRPFQIH